jgi:hypothetical protein
MSGNITRNAYSAWNSWPSKKVYYAEGVSLVALLQKAGLKPAATTINIASAPDSAGNIGFNATFLLKDLFAGRYTFEGAKKAVPAILALKLSESGFDKMDETDLRLVYGQLDDREQTTVNFVQSVAVITVTCAPARQLQKPEAAAELIAGGLYSVTLTHENANAKIYYTTDGSAPTIHSAMFNVSANHWQPQLNIPFIVKGDAQINAVAVAAGYADSEVLSFTADSLSGNKAPAVAGMANFVKARSYTSGQYTDVNENQWYGYNQQKAIANAFEYGLMQGSGAASFNPAGNMTLAEVVAVAARVRSIYDGGGGSFTQGSPWYQVYVDYAVMNGIIGGSDFSGYARTATRAEMAYIFSRCLPGAEFGGRNTVNSLPDVAKNDTYYESIVLLYRAGVITGSDASGTFNPGQSITRAEAAAIISRVILPDTRAIGRIY